MVKNLGYTALDGDGRLQASLKLEGPRWFNLDPDGPRVGRFGKHEIERAAGRLISYLQTLGSTWKTFWMADLHVYYEQRGWNPEEAFFGLTGQWFDDAQSTLAFREAGTYVVFLGDRWAVTDLFVKACMEGQ